MNVLVTGATGFVGSHLARLLHERGYKVVSLMHDTPVWTQWLRECLTSTIRVQGDVCDIRFLKRVLTQYEIQQLYHLAALSIVKRAWKDPVNTFDVNAIGTVNILEACRQLNIEKVMIQSTDKIYGNRLNATLASPLTPTEPYASSKICADIAAQTFIKTYDMNVIISRCCNIYGYDWNNRIVPNTIKACLRNESPIIFKKDKSKRQYIYIDDAICDFIELMEGLFTPGPYNIASQDVLSPKEIVMEILKHFPGLKPKYVKKPRYRQINSQSMYTEATDRIAFEEGINMTIEAFKRYWHG